MNRAPPAATSGNVDVAALLATFARELAPHVARELAALTPEPPATPAPLVDKREIARLLAGSPATIDRLVRAGMPHVPIGDVRRFDVDACRGWLADHGKESATTPTARSAPLTSASNDLGGVRLLSRHRRADR